MNSTLKQAPIAPCSIGKDMTKAILEITGLAAASIVLLAVGYLFLKFLMFALTGLQAAMWSSPDLFPLGGTVLVEGFAAIVLFYKGIILQFWDSAAGTSFAAFGLALFSVIAGISLTLTFISSSTKCLLQRGIPALARIATITKS